MSKWGLPPEQTRIGRARLEERANTERALGAADRATGCAERLIALTVQALKDHRLVGTLAPDTVIAMEVVEQGEWPASMIARERALAEMEGEK